MSIAEEELGGIRDGIESRFRHPEDANLIDRPKAILRRTEHPMIQGALALEVQNGIDDVLEGLRSGDATALCHVPDDKDGRCAFLRKAHQPRGTLPNLADVARRALEIGGEDRLNRIDDPR